jgi:hypothetical protein
MTRTRTKNPRTLATLVLLPAFIAMGALPSACGGKDKPAEDATNAFGSASATSDMPGAGDTASAPTTSASSDTPAPLGSVFTSGTGGNKDQKTFDALSAAPAAKLDSKGAGGAKDALGRKLQALAKKMAPGMAPEGPLARATLKEGERAQMDVTLEQGKCYAIVGTSDKVKDLDLQLMVPPGVMSAQDSTDDESPVIGKPPTPFCEESASAAYKLGIYAEKGAGDVAVQIYSKKK